MAEERSELKVDKQRLTVLCATLDKAFTLLSGVFDRVICIEPSEYVKNWELFFQRCAENIKPNAKVYIQVVTYRHHSYDYTTRSKPLQSFIKGVTVLSNSVLLCFQRHLSICSYYHMNGQHYEKLLDKWQQNLENNKAELTLIMANHFQCSEKMATQIVEMWRLFFLACGVQMAYNNGDDWSISGYTFQKRACPD